MAKQRFLSGKNFKHYTKLLEAKLETMGLADRQIQVKLGTKKIRFIDSRQKTDETLETDVIQLRNPFRNFLKRLRKLPVSDIQAFLNATISKPSVDKK
jgi:hypothetical protein